MKEFKKLLKVLNKKVHNKKILKSLKNIEVGFLDSNGKIREIIISKSKFNKIIYSDLMCDGSSIGEKETTDSDLKIKLDINSAYVLPNDNILIIGNTDSNYDARHKLIEVENQLIESNIKVNIGVELEFFVFSENNTNDNLGYFEIDNSIIFDCFNELMTYCEKVNFPIESFHHECGKNQFEINFKYSNPLQTADNIFYLKKLINYFTNKYNLQVSYLPKPFQNQCGSGMHTNISVWQDDKNLFFDKDSKTMLSKFALDFSNKILNHIEALTYISNPCDNSFERLKYGHEIPKEICISSKNRNALIRIPTINKNSARIEFRLPDMAANPYLLFCALIISGFDSEKTKQTDLKKKIPSSVDESKRFLKKDKLLKQLFPNKDLYNN